MWYHNPAPLSDFIPLPEEEEQIKDAIFSALYHSGAYKLNQNIFIRALVDKLRDFPFIQDHHIQEIINQSATLSNKAEESIELADAIYDGAQDLYPDLMGVGEKPMRMTTHEDGSWSVGNLDPDDDDDIIDADFEIDW